MTELPGLCEASEVLLARQLQFVAATSDFYQVKARLAGVDLTQIRSTRDLASLPFTDKDELRQTQEEHPPIGSIHGVPFSELIRIQGTGGTTGTPLRIGFTRPDLEVLDRVGAAAFHCAGVGPGDLVLQCMNYSLYVGGVTDHGALERAGCCVLPYSVGNSERLITLVAAMKTPWALYSTPSYAMRLAAIATGLGYGPRDLRLVRGLFSGEGGLSSREFRQAIEQTWGLTSRDIYGLSETGIVAAECDEQDGMHLVCSEALVVELIDPHTETVLKWADGVQGELVFTTIQRQSSFLLRFRSHDVATIRTRPCQCGRTSPRITIHGRTDDMIIVRGVNVYPLAVHDVLCTLIPEVVGEFQLILQSAPPIDYDPLLRVEAEAESADLADRVQQLMTRRLNFRPTVELVPVGSLPKDPGKARRLIRAYAL